MILGLSIYAFTVLHTAISLIGIAAGLVVLWGLLESRRLPGWTALFLFTTVLTSVTGFMFPIKGFTPALAVGAISLAVLAVTIAALYAYHLVGAWRWIYIAGAVFSLYLNVFVAVVQAFQKLPFLSPLAPTQSEPPFIVAQTIVLLLFVALGYLATRKFHPEAAAIA